MPAATRAFLEPRLGFDFGSVRIHDDAAAQAMAAQAHARAFTVGREVYFNAGQYAPSTENGRRLLAHELTHVAQQGSTGARGLGQRPLLRAAPMVQRDVSPEEVQRAETAHRADQQRIYQLIQHMSRWDYLRLGADSPDKLTAAQKAVDPHVLFNNSVDWILSRRIAFSVLSPVPGPEEKTNSQVLFDPQVNYPDLGGSVTSTTQMGKDADAYTNSKTRQIQLVAKKDLSADGVYKLIRHEVQHIADAHGSDEEQKRDEAEFQKEQSQPGSTQAIIHAVMWSKYQTEFRGYWLGSISRGGVQVGVTAGGERYTVGGSGTADDLEVNRGLGLSVPSPTPEGKPTTIQLQNPKQANIARIIINNYGGMKEAFLASPLFRARIQRLERPEGVNLVNSLRIERVRLALHGPATHQGLWGQMVSREAAVASAVQALDDTDLEFLKNRSASQPFWDDAKAQLGAATYAWMEQFVQGNRAAPPP